MVVRNLVVVSDTHCGCQLGLCPPTPVLLDEGGTYQPSPFQQKVWGIWREFWDDWVPTVVGDEPFDLVHNGDAIDGVHHRGTTQISHNIKDQRKVAIDVMKPEVARCKERGGTYFHIRGTEAHVGSSAADEETVAEALGAKKNAIGQHARNDIWKRVGGPTGPLVHLLHHISPSGSTARETTALNVELSAELTEAAQWGRQHPDVIVRSHRHRYSAIQLPTRRGYAISVVTPAWQGKTPFTWKIAGARLTEPQFGGLVIRYNDEGVFYVREFVRSFDRSPEE